MTKKERNAMHRAAALRKTLEAKAAAFDPSAGRAIRTVHAAEDQARGPWLNITTAEGELIKRIDLAEYDLSKPIARAHIVNEIAEAQAIAEARTAS